MTQTTARITKAGKHFEILVDLDEALKFKKGEISSIEAEGDKIFKRISSGEMVSSGDLQEAFGTTDVNEIVSEIVKKGEVQVTQEQRSAEQEQKFKQVVDFLATNAVDPQTGNPHSSERIKNALEQANVNIKNTSVENQINDILEKVSKVIPIRLEMKRVKITVPAMHTGKVYGIIAQYKEDENWLDNGDLEVTVKIPAGIVMDFYDKLNSVTHGSALTEEIKEKEE